MKILIITPILFLLVACPVQGTSNEKHTTQTQTQTQSYSSFVVIVDNTLKPSQFSNHVKAWYHSILQSLNSNYSLVHTYSSIFNGFSAKMGLQQSQELTIRPEILAVFPDERLHLHTTRSPEFLGLNPPFTPPMDVQELGHGSDNVIIGIMDTGIWPERRSFDDEGLGPVPTRWRGECNGGEGFRCNRKVIGARNFYGETDAATNDDDMTSARDWCGHGIHTASIAAGSPVSNASFYGWAPGNAPKARIAMYKVIGLLGGADSDVLAAIEAALSDGVDIISMSLRGAERPYHADSLAIAAFAAVKQGVFVSASAGNSGPRPMTMFNQAPWMTTVGSGTIDRAFPADLVLGDGRVITGSTLYAGKGFSKGVMYPFVYAGYLNGSGSEPGSCGPGILDPKVVKNKIVLCDWAFVRDAEYVRKAGGIGMVTANVPPMGETMTALPFLTPALIVAKSARAQILDYISSSKTQARATIRFRKTRIGMIPAPMLSYFSSRGPNTHSPDILKPDLIAPGSNILAAWPDPVSPSGLHSDKRRTEFNVLSGTSMSCPHISGIAALLKGVHPDWTPAMIKSAMMTTAYSRDRDGNQIKEEASFVKTTPWDIGAGHVDPVKAADPGLVYDLTIDDYVKFLCASNFSSRQVGVITGESRVDCVKYLGSRAWDLNYPAIVAHVNVLLSSATSVSVSRRLTNVGKAASSYRATVTRLPGGTNVVVDPAELVFAVGETHHFTVHFYAQTHPAGTEFGELTWTDGVHNVTSPLVLVWT